MAPKKIVTDAANVLILAKADDGYFYAAGPAWKLPKALSEKLDAYKLKANDPAILSTEAFIILLDEVEVTPPEWIAKNFPPKKWPPPPPPPLKSKKRR